MVPGHGAVVQASQRLLPNFGALMPARSVCIRAAYGPAITWLPAAARWGGRSAIATGCQHKGGPSQQKFCRFHVFSRYSACPANRFSFPSNCSGLSFVRRHSHQTLVLLATKKEEAAAEAVPSEQGLSDSTQVSTVADDESDADEGEDDDDTWEEGIAPLDEVEILLDGETEDGWDYEEEEEGPIQIGDGGDGGGIKVGSTFWGRKALEYAEEVLSYPEFAGKFRLYAFRAYDALEIVKVRLDKLEDTYGSPTMEEIQAFARAYNLLLDEATERKDLPIIETEVGSPGAERVVVVPGDLARFQDLPMVVRFLAEKAVEEKKERKGSKAHAQAKDGDGANSESVGPARADDRSGANADAPFGASLVDPSLASIQADQLEPDPGAGPKLIEHEEVFALESFDVSRKMTVWKLADTRANRASGKGRGLNRRQRDQRWHVPFSRLKVVRLYLEI